MHYIHKSALLHKSALSPKTALSPKNALLHMIDYEHGLYLRRTSATDVLPSLFSTTISINHAANSNNKTSNYICVHPSSISFSEMTSASKQKSSESTNINAATSVDVTDAQQAAESMPTEHESAPKRRRLNETTESTAGPCSLHAQTSQPTSNINKDQPGNGQPAPTATFTEQIATQPAPTNRTDQTTPQPAPTPVSDEQQPQPAPIPVTDEAPPQPAPTDRRTPQPSPTTMMDPDSSMSGMKFSLKFSMLSSSSLNFSCRALPMWPRSSISSIYAQCTLYSV